MVVMEINVSPEPEWAIKFQEYLETEYNFNKLDAMGAIGTLHQYMRKYKEPINEGKLNKFAEKLYPDFQLSFGEIESCEDLRDAFKNGFRKAKEL